MGVCVLLTQTCAGAANWGIVSGCNDGSLMRDGKGMEGGNEKNEAFYFLVLCSFVSTLGDHGSSILHTQIVFLSKL